MGTAIKHPVPNWVKPSSVIFDIWPLWMGVRVPGCQKFLKSTEKPPCFTSLKCSNFAHKVTFAFFILKFSCFYTPHQRRVLSKFVYSCNFACLFFVWKSWSKWPTNVEGFYNTVMFESQSVISCNATTSLCPGYSRVFVANTHGSLALVDLRNKGQKLLTTWYIIIIVVVLFSFYVDSELTLLLRVDLINHSQRPSVRPPVCSSVRPQISFRTVWTTLACR